MPSLTIRRAIAAWMKASPVEQSRSWSLAMRRLWEIHAKVRSTTHLRGKATYPRGGMSFSLCTFLPSLCHSLD